MISLAPRFYRWHTDRARLVLSGNKCGDSLAYQIGTLHEAGPPIAGSRGVGLDQFVHMSGNDRGGQL
jgi:hypothetical protein